jgi:hypothetical protein
VTEEIAASFVDMFEHYALQKKIVWNGLFIREFDQTNDHHVPAVLTTACQLDIFRNHSSLRAGVPPDCCDESNHGFFFATRNGTQ